MEELKESNGLYICGKGLLIATEPGTRKYGTEEVVIKDPKTGLFFRGLPLLDPGKIVHVQETPNIICNEGLQLFAGFGVDESAVYDVGITYCEIGTDATAPAITDVILTAYHGRKILTSASRLLYVDTFSTFFTAGESTAIIEEAGVWGGSNAAAGQATGLLVAHWLSSYDNSGGLTDLTFNYILTLSRL